MTTVPVTDIVGEYTVTTFSEDAYPCNKNYEITSGQMSILKSVNDKLLATPTHSQPSSDDEIDNDEYIRPHTISESVNVITKEAYMTKEDNTCRLAAIVSEVETIVAARAPPQVISSFPTQTPSLSTVYDKDKRMHLLEEEVATLRKKTATKGSGNLTNFTNLLFNKNPNRNNTVNKRVVIVNYASMNQVPLTVEDLEDCSDEEIDNMYKAIRQYHEIRKKKIVVTNFIIIVISIVEQLFLKLGFDDIKGLSSEITNELIDVEIGDDCEQIATRLGVNNPILNIFLFIIKLFIRRIRIL